MEILIVSISNLFSLIFLIWSASHPWFFFLIQRQSNLLLSSFFCELFLHISCINLNWCRTWIFNWITTFCPQNWSSHAVLQSQCEDGVQIPYTFTKLRCASSYFLSSPTCPLCVWSAHVEYGKQYSVNHFLKLLMNRECNWAVWPHKPGKPQGKTEE